MRNTIRQYIERTGMIMPGDAVCVGLSGGADSVCLLRVLLELYGTEEQQAMLSPEWRTGEVELERVPEQGTVSEGEFSQGTAPKESCLQEAAPERKSLQNIVPEDSCGVVRIHAVHVHHGLRGEAADADEAFVRELCGRWKVPLRVYHYPVAKLAAERGIGVEEAGRLARHEAYRDCIKEEKDTAIALAHHANDRAETFLFHAARGTSLAGLAGIRAVQPFSASDAAARIVRPLLCVTRPEIENWLTGRGQDWRMDETNRDETYARNALRHTVVPSLEEKINAQAVRHLAEASADLEEADRFLQNEAAQRGKQHVKRDGAALCIADSLMQEPAILQGYVLLHALEEIGGSRKDLGRVQIRSLQELFARQVGKQVVLPYGIRAVREYEGVRLTAEEHSMPQAESEETVIAIPAEDAQAAGENTHSPEEMVYQWQGWRFRVRFPERSRESKAEPADGIPADLAGIPRKQYTKWLDCDKINGTLCIRSRRSGDRLVVNAQGGSRKLKDYLIDEKVPRESRDAIPLLAAGRQILWVVGHRISEEAKVTADTGRILEITAEPPATDRQE